MVKTGLVGGARPLEETQQNAESQAPARPDPPLNPSTPCPQATLSYSLEIGPFPEGDNTADPLPEPGLTATPGSSPTALTTQDRAPTFAFAVPSARNALSHYPLPAPI